MQEEVGAVFVFYARNESIKRDNVCLSESCTVFQAEILANKEAAIQLLEHMEKFNYVRFFVDSQATILALHHKPSGGSSCGPQQGGEEMAYSFQMDKGAHWNCWQ